jgi:HPt (histidine-containing phosphotransfer) domain-containing protein
MAAPSSDPLVEAATLRELEFAVGAEVTLQLIEMFLDSGSERVDTVRKAAEAADTAAAAEILHSLKSSALTLGAVRFGRLAEQAERLAIANAAGELAAIVPELVQTCDETRRYLEAYRTQLG